MTSPHVEGAALTNPRLLASSSSRQADEQTDTGGAVTVRASRLMVVNQQHTGVLGESTCATRARQLCATGALDRPSAPCAVIYRMDSGGHRQTGALIEVPVGDYRSGRVRRHESTQPNRVRELARRTASCGLQHVPVVLTHPVRNGLRSLLTEAASRTPDVSMRTGDLAHSVWIEHDAHRVAAIHEELRRVDTLYIADGHHRFAAVEQHPSVEFALAALFPSDEMRVCGYHRWVELPPRMSAGQVLTALAARPMTARVEACAAGELPRPEPGVVVMRLEDAWYRIRLRRREGADSRAALDVVGLDEEILMPALGRARVHAHAGGDNSGGTDGDALAHWCANHGGAGFLLHPPAIDDVMAISDVGAVLPPKSTWFTPKAAPGLFARELE